MSNPAGLLMFLTAVFGAPALLARFLIGGEWRQVAAAFVMWFGFLFVVLVLPKGGTSTEKFGWMAIMAMFLTVLAVPGLTLVQRVLGWILVKAS